MAIDRGSLSQYARLFVSSVLPSDFKRVLYLDCDIIIAQSLEELWNLDMHGKTIAALKDAFSKWYRVNVDLEPNDIMFNSGVMLIDLDKWKEHKVEERLMKFISEKNGKIQQGDQGALNAVLTYDTYCFEPRFNSVTIFYDFNYKEMMIYRKPPKGFYTEAQIREAKTTYIRGSMDIFMRSFLRNTNVRPSCYKCSFKGLKRTSDFTISDCWGIGEKNTELNDDKGLSALLLQNQRAVSVFEKIKQNLEFQEYDSNVLMEGNWTAFQSVKPSADRQQFFDMYEKYGYEKAMNKFFKPTIISWVNYYLKRIRGVEK